MGNSPTDTATPLLAVPRADDDSLCRESGNILERVEAISWGLRRSNVEDNRITRTQSMKMKMEREMIIINYILSRLPRSTLI